MIVVIAVLGVDTEILHRLGAFLGEKLKMNVSDSRVKYGSVKHPLNACTDENQIEIITSLHGERLK